MQNSKLGTHCEIALGWMPKKLTDENHHFGKLAIICSDNSLSPEWRQAIIWTNAGILSIGPLGTNAGDNLIRIHTFIKEIAFENLIYEMAATLSWPQCVKDIAKHTVHTFLSYDLTLNSS